MGVVGIIGYGFYLMDIEDQYGDCQSLHFKAKSGDVLINKSAAEFGIIEKSWTRTNIKTKEKDSTDLYFWIWKNNSEAKVELYRPKNIKIDVKSTTYEEVKKLIDNEKLKIVTSN